jgi:hypothetical protein
MGDMIDEAIETVRGCCSIAAAVLDYLGIAAAMGWRKRVEKHGNQFPIQ